MSIVTRAAKVLGLWLLFALAGAGSAARADEVDFGGDIWPILQARCVECHGPDKQRSSFRVDSRQAFLAGGDSGAAIVPGDPDASLLLELVASPDKELRMPPKGDPLSAEEISRLSRWIRAGAAWPDSENETDPRREHWAFQPLVRPDVPVAGETAGRGNPIDAFVQAKLAEHELQMSAEADPRTFIRRATLDLTGLPPTPEEIAEFVAACHSANGQPSRMLPDAAVGRLIDRLLASPRYGERWAQHWLDVIRYADTTGYEKNNIRPTAWPYRDYVIAALNADTAYPQFILEQLAGDTQGVDAATGFLVTPPFPEPIEVGQEPLAIAQTRFNGLDEVLQNVGSAMLGMTVGCARCHDHKFDPMPVSDYYGLAATFAGLQFGDRLWDQGNTPVDMRDQVARQLREVRRELAAFSSWCEEEPLRTSHVFKPVRARFVRMTITATTEKQHPPGFDELEVWTAADEGAPSQNAALASNGAQARSSGADASVPSNDLLLNDGKHGVASLWVAANRADAGPTWVEIDLGGVQAIDRVAWCADPLELDKNFVRMRLRAPVEYRIEAAESPGIWHDVVTVPASDELTEHERSRRERLERTFAAAARRLRDLQHVFAGSFEQPAAMHVLRRGDPLQPREPVGPGGIDVLGSYELPADAPESQRRIAFARWLASDRHPLTARVAVNRVWHHHFGAGIVDTPSDFGLQGSPPTHPELLDWLASEFIARGWSFKALHRLICTSATYRQRSLPNPAAAGVDADSRLLWRFPPRRLEAEAIRDSMLYVSGSLDLSMGGPGVNIYRQKRFGAEWLPDETPGENTWRRAIYLLRVRGADDGLFKAFDVPDCGQVRAKRTASTTPLQALNLFNSPFTGEQARRLAGRVRRDTPHDTTLQIDRVFELLLSRTPEARERTSCLDTARQHGLEAVCRALLNSNEFLFVQ